MSLEISIGRDAASHQLNVSLGNKTAKIGSAGSVPMSVSRQHCTLTINDDGTMSLRNVKVQNTTYVNGTQIQSKKIQPTDCIELGEDRYRLDMKQVLDLLPKQVDVAPLKTVWEEYNNKVMDLNIAERKFGVWRSATSIIIPVAIVLGVNNGTQGLWPVYIVVSLLSLIFTIVAYRRATDIPKKQQELKLDFERKYVCPNCHHFLGYQSYDILRQNKACPYCHAEYKK